MLQPNTPHYLLANPNPRVRTHWTLYVASPLPGGQFQVFVSLFILQLYSPSL